MKTDKNQASVAAGLVVRWLEPNEVKASWDESSCRLVVHVGDEMTEDVRIGLAFPIRHASKFIDLRNEKNESIGMLRSLDGLDAKTLSALNAALTMRYMIPCITRVIDLQETSQAVLLWTVDTFRGEKTFYAESPRESVKHQSSDRIRITDLSGNHYDLPSIAALDAESRAILSVFL